MHFVKKYVMIVRQLKRPVSQAAKTSPSHGEGRGSIPLRDTMIKALLNKGVLFVMVCLINSAPKIQEFTNRSASYSYTAGF